MSGTKQILLAFFVQIFLAIGLILAGNFIFPPEQCVTTGANGTEQVCFYISDDWTPLGQPEYYLLAFGLLILALILPPFLTGREYQKKKAELRAKSIFN